MDKKKKADLLGLCNLVRLQSKSKVYEKRTGGANAMKQHFLWLNSSEVCFTHFKNFQKVGLNYSFHKKPLLKGV